MNQSPAGFLQRTAKVIGTALGSLVLKTGIAHAPENPSAKPAVKKAGRPVKRAAAKRTGAPRAPRRPAAKRSGKS